MATLATETWTGANGAAWPAQWTKGAEGGTQEIQGNKGSRTTPSVAWSLAPTAYLSGMAATVDTEVYIEIEFAAVTNQYSTVCVRAGGPTLLATGDPYPVNGYAVQLNPGGTTVEVNRIVASTLTSLATPTYTYGAASVRYGVRFSVIGAVVSVRVWDLAGAEPGTWLYSGTDGSPYLTAGKVLLANLNDAPNSPRTSLVDNLTVTDGAGAPAPASPGPVLARSAVQRAANW